MSVPFLQHSVLPENSQSSYTEYNNVDFLMTFENRALLGNSVRLVGDVRVQDAGVDLTNDKKIYLDPQIGAHSFIESINTSIQSAGNIENLTGYARLVGMTEDATLDPNSQMNSENRSELKAPKKEMTLLELIGENTGASTSLNDPCSFSIKPQFCLNATSGVGSNSTAISYTKTGAIRVVFNLARVFNALHGGDVDGNITYELTNLRLEFLSVPDEQPNNKTFHRIKYHIRQSVLSSRSNVSSKVPAACSGVSCSLVRASDENQGVANGYERQFLPLIDQIQFLFNNNTNEYIAYKLDDREEILMRYIESLKDTQQNSMSLTNLKANKSFGIGLFFGGEMVNLANQTFNISIVSSDSTINTSPLSLHLYFHSGIEL
jgi:hypothetical protein